MAEVKWDHKVVIHFQVLQIEQQHLLNMYFFCPSKCALPKRIAYSLNHISHNADFKGHYLQKK